MFAVLLISHTARPELALRRRAALGSLMFLKSDGNNHPNIWGKTAPSAEPSCFLGYLCCLSRDVCQYVCVLLLFCKCARVFVSDEPEHSVRAWAVSQNLVSWLHRLHFLGHHRPVLSQNACVQKCCWNANNIQYAYYCLRHSHEAISHVVDAFGLIST